jgi:hypothetical protein
MQRVSGRGGQEPIHLTAAAVDVGGGTARRPGGAGSTATKEGIVTWISVITTKVKAAILNGSTLKVNEINVETFKGMVQLSGFVRSRADIDQAVKVARGVAGVKSVKNDMRIK